jgi:peptidoglycan hydrolase-like protein with peptidoglycan-binding domain
MYMNGLTDQLVAKGVTLTQTALKNAGFDPGPIDGIMGPKTKAAIRAFQQAKGLKVDGIVGPATTAALTPYVTPPKPDPVSIAPKIDPLKTDVGTPDLPVAAKQNTPSPAPAPSAPPTPSIGPTVVAAPKTGSMLLPLLALGGAAFLLMQ